METRRLALTIAIVQLPFVFLFIINFEMRGAASTIIALTSFATAFFASLMVYLQTLLSKCPNCGKRYFSIMPIAFFISRRCASCGVREGEPEGSYWSIR